MKLNLIAFLDGFLFGAGLGVLLSVTMALYIW